MRGWWVTYFNQGADWFEWLRKRMVYVNISKTNNALLFVSLVLMPCGYILIKHYPNVYMGTEASNVL